MSPFDIQRIQGPRPANAPVAGDKNGLESQRIDSGKTAQKPAQPGVALDVGETVDPGAPPIAEERVAQIRAAIRDGTYPIVPAKIVDAIIAARIGVGL